MTFTERFLKVPVKLYDGKQAEKSESIGIEGDPDVMDADAYILPSQIEAFLEAIEMTEGSEFVPENKVTTWVKMKSGDTHLVYLTVTEFAKMLNEHQK